MAHTDDRNRKLQEKHSRRRGKTTLAKVCWGTVNAGASLAGPPGSLAADFLRGVVEHFQQYRQDRQRERLEDFARCVLQDVDETERSEFWNAEIDEDEIHAVLTALVNDEDEEKTGLYARALRTILKEQPPEEQRRVIIRTLKTLSFAELELARRTYIYANYLFPNYKAFWPSREEQVASIFSGGSSLGQARTRTLLNQGLLSEKSYTEGNQKKTTPFPTALLVTIVEAAYAAEDLRPESIGKRERSPIADVSGVLIVAHHENARSELLRTLYSRLFDHEVKADARPIKLDGEQDRAFLKRWVLFVITPPKLAGTVTTLREHVDFAHKNIVVALLPDQDDDKSVERAYTLDLRENHREQIEAFARWADGRIREHVAARKTAQGV